MFRRFLGQVYDRLQMLMVPPVSDANAVIKALLYHNGSDSPAVVALKADEQHFTYEQELERSSQGVYESGAGLESGIPVSPISLNPARGASAELAVLVDFVDPRHLDRFKDFLAGMFGVILEFGQFHHPAMQVGEADGARIDFRVGFGEFDRNIEGIRPLHFNDLP